MWSRQHKPMGSPSPSSFSRNSVRPQLFYGRIGGETLVVQAETGAISSDVKALTLAIPADKVHVFDASMGTRL